MDAITSEMFPLKALSPAPVRHSFKPAICGELEFPEKKNGADVSAP
jgi:hypothetical protein